MLLLYSYYKCMYNINACLCDIFLADSIYFYSVIPPEGSEKKNMKIQKKKKKYENPGNRA